MLLLVFLLWIMPGLVGRELWKADEPYSFGLVNHIVKTGDWVVPTLTGEPFMEKPPLFFITAAGFARTFSPWMQLHDAARLATLWYMGLAALFTGLAARELFGRNAFHIAVIVLIGTTGLQETAHKLITDIALIAGIAMGLYGLAVALRRPVLGGILIGTGAGIGFMSKGALAPGMLGIIAVTLPSFFAPWRNRTYGSALLIAAVAALPWISAWPLALYMRSPDLLGEWFWTQNIGRFFSTDLIGRSSPRIHYLVQLPYFALPSLVLAFWAIPRTREVWLTNRGIQLSLTAFLVMLLVLSLSSSIRDIYALPMLLPLALLATAGAVFVPDRVRQVMRWLSVGVFGLAACAIWVGWAAMVTGHPDSLARALYRLQPDYLPAFNALNFAAACLYTFLWLITVTRASFFTHAHLISWSAGIVLTWSLLMTLWLPWFEAGSGYRAMFTSLKERIPSHCAVIRSCGLGESERALFEYYTGVVPRGSGEDDVPGCDLMLMQSGRIRKELPGGTDWKIVWEQSRPSKPEKAPKEIFTLLRRDVPAR